MAHKQQMDFYKRVKRTYPQYFTDVKVLDVGSLDINGSTREMFTQPCYYIGLDLGQGKGVDVVAPGHLYDCGFKFDVVTTSETLEHDMFWMATLQNMVRLLSDGGMLIGTCATTGRKEHGTARTTPKDAPLLCGAWADYYLNLVQQDIEDAVGVHFDNMYFEVNPITCDLYFFAFLPPEPNGSCQLKK